MRIPACLKEKYEKDENGEDKRKDRMEWSSTTLFWMAGSCSAMGNSNFLVFPAHCAKHGGLLIFAIPYLFFLIFVAIPILTLLLGLGQKY